MRALLLGLAIFTAPAWAQTSTSLHEVVAEAKSMTQLRPGEVLIATNDGGYICAIETNPSYLKQLMNGVEPSPGYTPKSICYDVENVINLGEK